jgi:hypothetical protein
MRIARLRMSWVTVYAGMQGRRAICMVSCLGSITTVS